jgi:hypothetical protein
MWLVGQDEEHEAEGSAGKGGVSKDVRRAVEDRRPVDELTCDSSLVSLPWYSTLAKHKEEKCFRHS